MRDRVTRRESIAACGKHMVHFPASYKSVAGKQKSAIRKIPLYFWRRYKGQMVEKRRDNIFVMGKYNIVLFIVLSPIG